MPGKRKRNELVISELLLTGTANGRGKPLSAVTAAKLKIQSSTYAESAKELSPSPSLEPSPSDVEPEDSGENSHEDRQNVQLCTWRYEKRNIVADNSQHLIITLDKNKTIAFVGSYAFVVLKGAINISGANVVANPRLKERAQWHHVCAPSTHPIPIVRGLDDSNEIKFRSSDLQTPLSNNPLFADIWRPERTGFRRTFLFVAESGADPLKRPIVPELAPDDWTRQIEDFAGSSSTIMITGSSSSGKSIFARRLLNRYLAGYGRTVPALPSVCYLDLDPSRPEYSPHGQISLVVVRAINLGPSFMHPTAVPRHGAIHETVRAHPFPMGDSQNYLNHFISCVEDLFRAYGTLKQQHRALPLIVRVPSWFSSTNFGLLLRVITYIKPQFLVRLGDLPDDDEVGIRHGEALQALAARLRFSVHQLSGQGQPDVSSRTEEELRSMQMLSYFHSTGTHHEFSTDPVCQMVPWELHYEESKYNQQASIGFLMLCEWIKPSHIMTALNGAIVQIMETEDLAIQQLYGKLSRTKKFRIPYLEKGSNGVVEPLNPRTSRLVCTAILRGWDPDKRVAQVIVPSTHEALIQDLNPKKTVVVFGCCEYPQWAYTENVYREVEGKVNTKVLAESNSQPLPPWVATTSSVKEMAFLNISRRVRKFQQ
ncbi:hypothetical protein P154DRAFT_576118 [Amniculicola lignicola CBS 123094]|uniref:Polynucleotide 5'-hydroxyl-kinase GRC3 n=1 Tax=Amniculicola lignicola CBS 123094 TaxID=1392246 RepID=A0A6A5WJV4_9PLEO|nr:hypothetical protein P154DRAFT_576118 [Amniculicola lignicola CBS 123094]